MLLALMKKYADTPMDFVDACMVVMTEAKRDCHLITATQTFIYIGDLRDRRYH